MSFKQLAARARGQWDQMVPALAPDQEMVAAIERGDRRHGFCPVHGGENGDAFRVYPDFKETGGACCNTCGAFANGFALLVWLKEWSFAQAAKAVEDYLDGTAAPANRVTPIRQRPVRRKPYKGPPLRVLKNLWAEACPIRGTGAGPLRTYLADRGLALKGHDDSPPYVRFHPKLLYCDGAKRSFWAGMLACLLDRQGRIVGLHRTYLDPSNGCKAPVRVGKKVLRAKGARLQGSAIRLYRPARVMGLAEGIETAIAVRMATGMPVWATTSAALMKSVVIPRPVQRAVIWADRDKAGKEAAQAANKRLTAQGHVVEIRYPHLPKLKSDWNDALREQGVAGFPERYRRAG